MDPTITWPPGSASVILNYGSADPDCKKFPDNNYFIKHSENFCKNKYFIHMNVFLLPIRHLPYYFNGQNNFKVGSGSIFYWLPGSGSIIQDNESGDPDPCEMFTDPEH